MDHSITFSHQEFIFGEDSVSLICEEHVLIYGMTDLGAEIAKNLVLSGIKHITIQDNEVISKQDIETNILAKLENGQINTNRASACYEKLKSMNLNVDINVIKQDIKNYELKSLLNYQLIILCDQFLSLQIAINNFCASQNPPIKFISANSFGILCSIFCDLRFNNSNNDVIIQNQNMTIEKQIWNPNLIKDDIGKQKQEILHLGLVSLYEFEDKFGRLPDAGNENDHNIFLSLAENLKKKFSITQIDKNLFELLSSTSKKCLPFLSTFLGGIVSQEALKSIIKKFDHLNQWLHFCTPEIVPNSRNFENTSKICIDETLIEKLKNIRLFMIGCGSTGCEILKNLAFLNASTENGEIIISDDDDIGKTHVTRHFLFSSNHINQSKSITASREVLKINPKMKIIPNINRFSTETENVYNDNFIKNQDIIIANVDNFSIRRYLDKCCLQNGKPWIDTGSMGFYGHVQVILPHLTEKYTAISDYSDIEYPYCTIKSFPMQIEHTIQWAYEKFLNLFIIKPSCYNEVWRKNGGLNKIIQILESGQNVNGLSLVLKVLSLRPKSWKDCVEFARKKFEKYFSHKARQLLSLFPLDYISEGKSFWQYPKCAPIPLLFEWKHVLHRMFIISTAKLHAKIWNIPYTEDDLQINNIYEILQATDIPGFKPNPNKKVITAEDEKPTDSEIEESPSIFLTILKKEVDLITPECLRMFPQKFNKYDETEQMNFIYAASNLRALMYNIQTESYLKIRFIAGKIVPSLPSTNAVIAALAILELLKFLKCLEKKQYSNYFINLSQPNILFSEPAPPLIYKLKKDLTYTDWDYWNITEQKEETLQQFLNRFQNDFNLKPTMIVNGTKILWLSIIPSYDKRKSQTMKSLIEPLQNKNSAVLSVSIYNENGEEDMAPPILYHFQK